MRKTKAIAALAVFALGAFWPLGQALAQEEADIDPSKPTNLYTFVDFNFEWQGFERGDTVGLRVMPTIAFNAQNMVQVEIPIQNADFENIESSTGLGDIRVRYFGLPMVREATLSHVGASVDVFLPAGDENKGLGSGSWIIAPGVLFGIAASDTLNFYPILSYQYSASVVNCTAGGSDAGGCVPPGPGESESDGSTQAVSVEVMTVFGLPAGMWFQVIPKYSEVFDGPESRSFNTRLNWGWMLPENLSLSVDFLHEFENRDGLQNHVRVGVGYYF
jgi:hypothetical protein